MNDKYILTCSRCAHKSDDVTSDMHAWDGWAWLSDDCLCPDCIEKKLIPAKVGASQEEE